MRDRFLHMENKDKALLARVMYDCWCTQREATAQRLLDEHQFLCLLIETGRTNQQNAELLLQLCEEDKQKEPEPEKKACVGVFCKAMTLQRGLKNIAELMRVNNDFFRRGI